MLGQADGEPRHSKLYENMTLKEEESPAVSSPEEEEEAQIYANMTPVVTSQPIKLGDIAAYIAQNKGGGFKEEFDVSYHYTFIYFRNYYDIDQYIILFYHNWLKVIPTDFGKCRKAATKSQPSKKNRFRNICPCMFSQNIR